MKKMEVNALAAHHLGSMAVWEPQGVWLALGEQVRGIQALPPPSQRSSPEGRAAPPTEACLKSLCSEPRVGLLQIQQQIKCVNHLSKRHCSFYKNKTLLLEDILFTPGNTYSVLHHDMLNWRLMYLKAYS